VKIIENAASHSLQAGAVSGLGQISGRLRRNALNIIVFVACVLLYYVVIARRYFSGDVIGGDTQLVWSLHYFIMESLVKYLQFPLWDSTTLNGIPLHLMAVNGWYQYLHPFNIPFLLAATIAGRVFDLDSSILMVVHKTLYLFSLNLIAVMLVTRELCCSRLARLLPPLVFTLSSIQFFALRDSIIIEGLAPSLFFMFGLLYHANRRTGRSLIVFLIFLALYIFGFSYAYLLSSVWWTGTFTLLVLLTSRGLLADSWDCVRQLWGQRITRWNLLLVAVFVLVAAGVAGLSVVSAIGELVRASGDAPFRYDVSSGGQFGPRSVFSREIWTGFLVWAPFPDIHQHLLKFDPWEAGIHHRYMGFVLMPLLVIAALFGHRHRYVWPLLLTAFISIVFLTYTAENAVFAWLLDNIPPIRNTRTLAHALPRDGPALLLVFAAGIGLDILLRNAPDHADERLWATARIIMIVLMVVAGELLLACTLPSWTPVRHSLAHMAGYLGLFSLLVLVLAHGVSRQYQRVLVLAMLSFVAMDLIISASAYAKLPHTWSPKMAPNAMLSRPSKLGPIQAGDPQWVDAYRGQFHNLYGGPYVGTRAWLVVATHPSWQPVLQNWDVVGRHMKAYPDFRFFTNAAHVPFDAIRDIDRVTPPSYVIEKPTLLVKNGDTEEIQFRGSVVPVEKGFAGFVESASPSGPTVAFAGWAIDEKRIARAREVLIFVGDTLWGGIVGNMDRADLAAYGRGAGFMGLLDGVPPAEQKNIRAFAVVSDGTARELQYSPGYPFTRGYGPGPERLRARPAAAGPPTIYLHDQKAVLPNGPGREEKISWSVLDWAPNGYAVRVSVPEDGYLLNLENYNRYWKASVDGKAEAIMPANFTLQAIKLSRGEHVIAWEYDPLPFKLAWLLFYAVLAVVLVSLALSFGRLPDLPSRRAAVVD
jgi:hypothetical protein